MPDLNDFPNELLVEIFSHFDLKTLTRCMRVNKSFKAITEHSAFDKVFWRSKPIKPGDSINLDKLLVNPIFYKLAYHRIDSKHAAFPFCDEKPGGEVDYRELALVDSSAAKQNATEPAVTHLFLSPDNYVRVNVNSERAVTVQDLMHALCDYDTKAPPYVCHDRFEGFYKSRSVAGDGLTLSVHWYCWMASS